MPGRIIFTYLILVLPLTGCSALTQNHHGANPPDRAEAQRPVVEKQKTVEELVESFGKPTTKNVGSAWVVGNFGPHNNKAASIKNGEGKFTVDEYLCHLEIENLRYLYSREMGIIASIDGQKLHIYSYKAEGKNNSIMTFPVSNRFIAELKKGGRLNIWYFVEGHLHGTTFTLHKSTKAINNSRDGHFYNLEKRQLEKKYISNKQQWKTGTIIETTVGFYSFDANVMFEWIDEAKPIDPYARLNGNIKLYEGNTVKVDMNSKRTHAILRLRTLGIYFYKVEFQNHQYWVIGGAIGVDEKRLW